MLVVVWRESGASPVKQPMTSGLGSTLIDHAIPGATVSGEFQVGGVACTAELPLPPAETGAAGGTRPPA
jgi:hypothetical protein